MYPCVKIAKIMETCQVETVKKLHSLRFIFNVRVHELKGKPYAEYASPFYKLKAANVTYSIRFTIVSDEPLAKGNSNPLSQQREAKLPEICLHIDYSQSRASAAVYTYQVACSVLTRPELGVIGFQGRRHQETSELRHPEFFGLNELKRAADEAGCCRICFDIARFSENEGQTDVNVDRSDSSVNESLNVLSFFKTGEYSDVTLRCKSGREFKAHKIVLAARSPAFTKIFASKTPSRGKLNELLVPDEFKPEVVAEMLNYIYTGAAVNMAGMAGELLALAKLYQLDDLEKMCLSHLEDNIDETNVVEIMRLSEKHELKALGIKAAKFLKANEHTVVKQEEFIKWLLDRLTVDKVADTLVLVDKYRMEDQRKLLMEFIAKNFKDVIKDANYRNLYSTNKARLVVEVDEYLATHYAHLRGY